MKEEKIPEKKEPKVRKVTKGPIREKARTMQRLISAVGKVLKKKGYAGLSIAAIAKEAKLDRKLIYLYFGGLDQLVEAYIAERDFWKLEGSEELIRLAQNPEKVNAETLTTLLQSQLNSLMKDQELQKIIHWEIGESNAILRKIADEREELGNLLLNQHDDSFDINELDFRAILALQVGGVYYLALHSQMNGSTFCGIDINETEGKQRILNAIRQIVDFCFSKKR